MRIPELVAHRGYPRHYPENTLIGFEAAIHAGARWIETDIQLTADRVPVLFHDRRFDRLCGVPGAMHETGGAAFARLRVSEFTRFGYRYAQVPVTTLAELVGLLKKHPQVTAFIELKRVSIEVFGAELVLERVSHTLAPVAAQCVLISYSLSTLLLARQQGGFALGAVFDRWAEHHRPILASLKPEYVFSDADHAPRFGRIAFANAKTAFYEVTDPARALRLAAQGADLIETFAFGEMQEALAIARGADPAA